MSSAYKQLVGEADFRHACDTVLAMAEREILILDRDLAALQLDEKARIDCLTAFLRREGSPRIRIVLHDPLPLERSAPRLRRLMTNFAHVIELRQSPEHLRHLADMHLLVDAGNGVRRFHVDQPRSALVLGDPAYLASWRLRFEELWELSQPCLRRAASGL
jgi:hypothetical protein